MGQFFNHGTLIKVGGPAVLAWAGMGGTRNVGRKWVFLSEPKQQKLAVCAGGDLEPVGGLFDR